MASRRTVLASLGVAAVAIAAAVGVVLVASYRSSSSSPSTVDALAALPAAPPSALQVPRPLSLARSPAVAHWASVRRAVPARARPGEDAPVVADLDTTTPEGTTNIVLVLGRARDSAGGLWIHVRLPVLPNDRTAWVQRWALGVYGTVHTRLDVDLQRLTATLFRDGQAVFHAPIGAGRSQWPTPAGEFYIRDVLTRYASPQYGPIAFGTSARSQVLTDWPGGGFVGIHGTDEPNLIPGRISHGCIRLRNEDIRALSRLMQIGTPVTIR
jgi:lipoprotein-anchoring transpeptidase ErfK/SrfK